MPVNYEMSKKYVKRGLNKTDQNVVRRMHEAGASIEEICEVVRVNADILQGFLPKKRGRPPGSKNTTDKPTVTDGAE